MTDGMNQEQMMLTKELGQRRVYLFFAIWIVIAAIGLIGEEMDKFNHVIDDYILIIIGLLVLLIIILKWKDQVLAHLRNQHMIIVILFVIALIFKIYAFTQEMGDPTDVGDEIPITILLILGILNGFL